jgi:hypothetical protein
MAAIVDALTGIIYAPPIGFAKRGSQTFGWPLLQIGYSVPSVADIEFRLDSRLMIIRATYNNWKRMPMPSYTFYYLWENNVWRLLIRVPLEND